MLMFIAGFLTFMAIGGFPSFVEDMKVKHIDFVCLYIYIYVYILHWQYFKNQESLRKKCFLNTVIVLNIVFVMSVLT